MVGWRTGAVSFVVAFGLLLIPLVEPAPLRAAGGCSLGLAGTPQVGHAITISGAGYPANAGVDITFSVSGQETDAFQLTSDSAGAFRIDLTLEAADLGPTIVTASVSGSACTAQVRYTVVAAGGATPGATPAPTPVPRSTATPPPTATPHPVSTPKPAVTPKPRVTPKPSPAKATPTAKASRSPRASRSPAVAGAAATRRPTPPSTDNPSGTSDSRLLPALGLLALALIGVGLAGWAINRPRTGTESLR